MTKKEAVKVLAILKAAYPSSYNGMTKEEANGTVSIWAMQFADMPADIVMMAIHKLISSCKFPPSVAEVKDKIKSIHWETYDIISGSKGFISEDLRAKYHRIYEATADYKYGKGHEPKVLQMVSTQARLGSGEQ